jgi:hypothetical protein
MIRAMQTRACWSPCCTHERLFDMPNKSNYLNYVSLFENILSTPAAHVPKRRLALWSSALSDARICQSWRARSAQRPSRIDAAQGESKQIQAAQAYSGFYKLRNLPKSFPTPTRRHKASQANTREKILGGALNGRFSAGIPPGTGVFPLICAFPSRRVRVH